MTFKDCILGHIESGKITRAQGEGLLQRFDSLSAKYSKAGRSAEAAALAAEEILQAERRVIEQRHRNLRQHALKVKQINKFLDETPGPLDRKVSDLYQRAAYRSESIKRTVYKFMDNVADSLKADFFELKRDHKTFSDGIRAALGESIESAEARQVGEVIKQTFDYLNERYRQAGGIIGKIDNYFPQIHRKEAIRKVSKDEWVRYFIDRVDFEKMIDDSTGISFTREKLAKIMADDYDAIVTGGRSELQKLVKKGEGPPRGSGDIDSRRTKSRFYHFKDANAFLEYNQRFGVGDEGLINAFLGQVESMSRDIGALELLGPRPHAISRFLDFKMNVAGVGAIKRGWVNAQYKILTSKFAETDVDALWWKVFAGSQNWLRSAMLGAASISAISDTAFIGATAKINGLGVPRALNNYAKLLAPGDREAKELARRAGFITEVIQGTVLNDTRFAGEAMGGKFTGTLAGLTHKFSGLAAMTKATQDAIALEGMATVAEAISAKKAWKDLPEDLRKGLGKFGLTADDWRDLGKAPIIDNGSAKFLMSSDLRVSEKFEPLRAKQLADKFDDWIMYLRQTAANEPLLATKAITSGAVLGDGAPASLSRVIGASVGMFKSFPITVIMTHTLPALRRAGLTPSTIGTPFAARRFDHLAAVTIATTILGGTAMQLKEMMKGRTPKEADNYKFWMAAFLQGGGLGLFGDFFLGDYSRFDRTPISEALGPTVGLMEDIYQATKGNLDKYAAGEDPKNPMRDAFNVAKRNIPLGSLWYGRLAVERLILDNLERAIDPGFDQRMRRLERRLTKKGQKFIWAPGEKLPDPKVVLGE